MQKILVTGAAGDVGSRLRKLLKGVYPRIVCSDIRKPADLGLDEEFIAADLSEFISFVCAGNRSEPDSRGHGNGDE